MYMTATREIIFYCMFQAGQHSFYFSKAVQSSVKTLRKGFWKVFRLQCEQN